MKAVLQDLKSGKVSVADVPPPALQPGGVLVRVRSSLVSIGTERAVIALAKKTPLGKARERPDLAQKVLNKAKQEGYWNTYQVVRNLISSPIPLGYSCAGEVIEVGAAAGDFSVGDRVACAGLNYANHAEIDYIPRNLVARMPAGLEYDDACFVTLGAIAMQGVRLANIELGERVVVLGLGLVGQIALQIARCSGARIFAYDLDPAKVELALQLGAQQGVSDPAALGPAVDAFTDGHGADAVLVCAATKSDGPLADAAAISRLKGRVIVIGDVGMSIQRRPYFEKELQLIISRSYGPGRYDPSYEVHGVDYPLPYVRWTEQRNMQSFLELIASGDLRVAPLVTHRFPIENVEPAYELVTGERDERAIAILIEYAGEDRPAARVTLPSARPAAAKPDTIRFGVIGAGQFAKAVLLPAFRSCEGVRFDAVCTASGLTSRKVAETYGARYCTSDAAAIIADDDIDAVIIATRHDQHAALVSDALSAGKAVFVEKPLAITGASLAGLASLLRSIEAPRLMVGFNRRFAPLAETCRAFFANRANPLFVTYRVNAGTFPPETWVFDPVHGGGRILGEVCHFIDTIAFLTGSRPARVHAEEIRYSNEPAHNRDSLTITLRMEDDSVGSIHYLADGDPGLAKEYFEVFGGRRAALLDNYRTLSLHSGNKRRRKRLMNQAKGHQEEVERFVRAVRRAEPMPIDVETILAVSAASFAIHRSLDTGGPVDVIDAADLD
ncbi:MAG TPA: bi-domain-containing oxidoreductase [Longimicrobiales bacterium]|nr:bi-domain-containing oxidoreductase [Longimicrobiales bacterium]